VLSNEKEIIQSTSSTLSLFQIYTEALLPLLQETTITNNGRQNQNKSITNNKSSSNSSSTEDSDHCPICQNEIIFHWNQPEAAVCQNCSIDFGRCCYSLEITDNGEEEKEEEIQREEKLILICSLCSTQAIYKENNNDYNGGNEKGEEIKEQDRKSYTCPYCTLIMKKL
jgi:ribosomal protein L37AE/L43A